MGQVKAYSEKGAIDHVYGKTGGASAYTGKARRLYSVAKV